MRVDGEIIGCCHWSPEVVASQCCLWGELAHYAGWFFGNGRGGPATCETICTAIWCPVVYAMMGVHHIVCPFIPSDSTEHRTHVPWKDMLLGLRTFDFVKAYASPSNETPWEPCKNPKTLTHLSTPRESGERTLWATLHCGGNRY